jgi:hypothetical protein
MPDRTNGGVRGLRRGRETVRRKTFLKLFKVCAV